MAAVGFGDNLPLGGWSAEIAGRSGAFGIVGEDVLGKKEIKTAIKILGATDDRRRPSPFFGARLNRCWWG